MAADQRCGTGVERVAIEADGHVESAAALER